MIMRSLFSPCCPPVLERGIPGTQSPVFSPPADVGAAGSYYRLGGPSFLLARAPVTCTPFPRSLVPTVPESCSSTGAARILRTCSLSPPPSLPSAGLGHGRYSSWCINASLELWMQVSNSPDLICRTVMRKSLGSHVLRKGRTDKWDFLGPPSYSSHPFRLPK